MIFFYIFLISASFASDEELLITHDFAEALKKSVTWEVEDYESNVFRDWNFDQARSLLLTSESSKFLFDTTPSVSDYTSSSVPESYDFRKIYPSCKHAIRNQGNCGSCWAFASVESLADRFCQQWAHQGVYVVLSPQELVSCCEKANGCGGGWLDNAFDYFEDEGVVTEECIPYESQQGKEPPCANKCKKGEYKKYKCTMNSGHYYAPDIEKLKLQLMVNGTIAATFLVYKDFYYYKGGVYYHKAGNYIGMHAVEVIGWGKENNMNYWLIANSWGTDWGEKGYFRMKIDDCGIHKGMMSCIPKF